jgi:hypothetical protein
MVGVAVVPISISGWGLRELAVVSLLGHHGIAPERALLFSVCFGLTLAIASLPGAVAWLWYSFAPSRHPAEHSGCTVALDESENTIRRACYRGFLARPSATDSSPARNGQRPDPHQNDVLRVIGCSTQFGVSSAPRWPHCVHTKPSASDLIGVSSGRCPTVRIVVCLQ